MPLPLALAGPIAGGIAYNVLTIGRKYGLRLLIVAAFVASTVALVASIKSAASVAALSMPSELGVAASWVVWPDAITQISIYMSALFTRWLYDNQVWLLEAKGRGG